MTHQLLRLSIVALLSALCLHGQTPTPREIERWVADLGHIELSRQEAATQALISAGDPAAKAVSKLCDASDRGVALRARRIFGAIVGVPPKVDAQLRTLLADQAAARGEIAQRICDLGEAAIERAMKLLVDKERPKLRAEVIVRHGLRNIAAGEDRSDKDHARILDLGPGALPALRSLLGDRKQAAALRVQALWIHGLLESRGRAKDLCPLFADPDPLVRREAIRSVAQGFCSSDFELVARSLPRTLCEGCELLASAAASRMDAKKLSESLSGDDSAHARFAALCCGSLHGEMALSALIAQAEREPDSTALRCAVASALGRFHDEKAVDALLGMYSKEKDATVRGAAIASLGVQAEVAKARLGLIAALLDPDQGVRCQATEAIGRLGDRNIAPALVAASEDKNTSVRNRALAALETLLPSGPRRSALRPHPAFASSSPWESWVHSEELQLRKDEQLPWFESSADARRIVSAVKSRIQSDFFYFDKKQLVDSAVLDAAAMKGMQASFEKEGGLEVQGTEREIIKTLISQAKSPTRVLGLLGSMPFTEAKTADLIRLSDAASFAMVRSLGDRFSRLISSNAADGRVKPSWLPGLLEDSGKSNGFSVHKKGDGWEVDFVFFDSPAWYAGFRVGDRLIKVGDDFTNGLTRRKVMKAIRKGGAFHLLREGWNRPYAFELEPAEGRPDRLVTATRLPDGVGYLRLKMFEMGCSGKIEAALLKLEREGIKGLILDLRNNPGGTVIDAIAIVDKFLPKGKIITTNETRSGEDEVVKSSDSRTDRDYPLVVLVNPSSASAAEMTSGSLQGNERATIIGTTSYGKGIGQNGSQIPGFLSRSALGESRSTYNLYLTMMRYYLPKDRRSIHHVGVEPDIVVKQRSLKGSSFDKAMRTLRHPAIAKALDALMKKDRSKALELAIDDGGKTSSWPGFEALYAKVKRNVSKAKARRLMRARLRARLLPNAEKEEFSRLLCDLEADRVLQAAVAEIMKQAKIESDDPRYRRIRRK